MSACAVCLKQDAPHVSIEYGCNCGVGPTAEPWHHRATCECLEHDVVRYFVKIHRRELVITAEKPDGELPRLYHNWKLIRDGRDYFRVRLMCRACIEAYELQQERVATLNKRRAQLSGNGEKTYSQVILSQG